MSSETSLHAIVLRRRDSGESDRRLTVLSAERGKLDVIAKGARKATSRLAGSSDPLTLSQMNIAEGKANRFVTQVQPISSYRGIRSDYERLQYALGILELYAAIVPYDEPAPEIFELLARSLTWIEHHKKPKVALAWCQVKLLEASGFLPEFSRCVVFEVPIQEAVAFVSPHAGGYVCQEASIKYVDRFEVRAEVLYGLSKLPELSEPPKNLKFVEETITALFPFWRAIADAQLPANEGLVGDLQVAIAQNSLD